jgi:hypothetical protein
MSQRSPDFGRGVRFSTGKYSPSGPLLALLLVMGTDRAVAGDPPAPPRLSSEQQQRLKERDRHAEEMQQLRAQGKVVEAQAAAAQMLAIEREVLGPVHEDVAASLDQIANLSLEQEEFAKARAALPLDQAPDGSAVPGPSGFQQTVVLQGGATGCAH